MYIVLDGACEVIHTESGDVRLFKTYKQALDYRKKNDAFGSWTILNYDIEGNIVMKQCSYCEELFYISGDYDGTIHCPYCGKTKEKQE